MHLSLGRGPRYVAVDMRDYLTTFGPLPNMQYLYVRFPVRDLIATILSINQYIGYNESMWFEMERRFSDALFNDPRFDPNTLELFFETMAYAMDAHIRERVPSSIDMSEYIFDKWVDATSIMMKRDETVEIYRDHGANDYIPPMHQFHPHGAGKLWSFP